MGSAALPILSLTQTELDARTKNIGSRQLVFNITTGELRHGGPNGSGNWSQCVPVGMRADTEVVAATTGNVTTATALNAGDVVDGVTLVAGDLVLVKSQTAQAENGVYLVGATPARAAAYNTWAEHVGKRIYVTGGTVNKKTYFFCSVAAGGTLETTAITFDATPTGPIQKNAINAFADMPVISDADVDGTELLLLQTASGQLKVISITDLYTYIEATLP